MPRTPRAEFRPSVRQGALRDAGLNQGEVHHAVPVARGLGEYGIAPDVLSAPFNAQGYTHDQHVQAHRDGVDPALVAKYQRLQPRLIPD